jgi:hypothetical protein
MHTNRCAFRVVRGVLQSPVARIILALAVLSTTACTSTNLLREDYAPRLSAQAVPLEQAVGRSGVGPIQVLAFEDRRASLDPLYDDPKLVWKGKGIYEYRFASKTVAAYLQEALVFDLSRLGFKISADDTPEQREPRTNELVLGVQVLECRPEYDAHFASVSPFYRYEYNVTLWNADRSRALAEKVITKKVEGVREPSITFATLSDRLLNDHLSEMSFEIARFIIDSVGKH